MIDRFPQQLAGLATLAVAIVTAAFLLADGIRDIKRADDQIEVTGSARRAIRSDFVVWRVSVNAQEATLQAAYSRLKGHSDRVRAYLRLKVLPDSVLTVKSVDVTPLQEQLSDGRETGRILGYRLVQQFEVRSSDVDGITRLSQEATELINQGVELTPQAPEYLFTALAQVRVRMLAEATQDAKARAEAIAGGVGGAIGGIRSVRVGVFQITPRFSTEVSDYGVNDTSSLEKDVTAVVRVTFAIR